MTGQDVTGITTGGFVEGRYCEISVALIDQLANMDGSLILIFVTVRENEEDVNYLVFSHWFNAGDVLNIDSYQKMHAGVFMARSNPDKLVLPPGFNQEMIKTELSLLTMEIHSSNEKIKPISGDVSIEGG